VTICAGLATGLAGAWPSVRLGNAPRVFLSVRARVEDINHAPGNLPSTILAAPTRPGANIAHHIYM